MILESAFETASDQMSVTQDENSIKEASDNKKPQRPPHLDITPAPQNYNSKKPITVSRF